MAAAESRHEWPKLFRILDGDRSRKMFEMAQKVSNVKKEVTEKMGEGDLETTQNLGDVEIFPEGQLGSTHNLYGHQDTSPTRTNTTAVTTTLTTAIGKSPFQPNFMSWS